MAEQVTPTQPNQTPPPATDPAASQNQTPPPEPAPAAPTPPREPAKPVDPWVEKLAKSFDMVIGTPVEEPPKQPDAEPKPDDAPAQAKPDATPAPDPASTPQTPPPPAQDSTPKPVNVDGIMAKLKANDPVPPPVDPDPTPQSKPDTKPDAPEDEYDKTLTGAAKDEIEFARFAEAKGAKGKVAETRAFLKKLDAWTAENPNSATDSEEFQEFVNRNKPRYSDGERKRLEMLQIREDAAREAEERIRRDVDQKLADTQRRLREIEIKPIAEAEVKRFVEGLVTTNSGLPEGVKPIDSIVAKRIEEIGFDAAAKEFPIEAPIVYSTIMAGQEFVSVAKGLKRFDPKNETHAWLGRFVEEQERIFESSTPENQRTVNGRKFVPRWKHTELRKSDPAEAAKVWSFSDDEVLDMLKVNAHIAAKVREDEWRTAGYVRQRQSAPATSPQSTPSTAADPPQDASDSSGSSPKAGASRSPGAGNPRPKAGSSEGAFLDLLYPGASKMLGL